MLSKTPTKKLTFNFSKNVLKYLYKLMRCKVIVLMDLVQIHLFYRLTRGVGFQGTPAPLVSLKKRGICVNPTKLVKQAEIGELYLYKKYKTVFN